MRFLRISAPYSAYLERFYATNRGLAKKPYDEQYKALLNDSFQQIDAYGAHLSRLGYDCLEVVANARPLQAAWCRERNIPLGEEDFDLKSSLAMAAEFQPDVVLLVNALRYPVSWIKALREACPRLRCVLGWCGIDTSTLASLGELDRVLTCNKELALSMTQMGLKVDILPFAFNAQMLRRIDGSRAPINGASFIGSVRRSDGFHSRRGRLLERLSEQFPLEVYTENREETWSKIKLGQLAFDICEFLREVGVENRVLLKLPALRRIAGRQQRPAAEAGHPLWRSVRPPVFGLRYYQSLRDYCVTLNVHPECAGDAAGNIRLFEATGVGACLLTDWKKDLHEFFELDRDIVTFKSDDECVDKLSWLLDHDAERRAIALSGQRRTIAQHNFDTLAHRLDELIRKITLS